MFIKYKGLKSRQVNVKKNTMKKHQYALFNMIGGTSDHMITRKKHVSTILKVFTLSYMNLTHKMITSKSFEMNSLIGLLEMFCLELHNI